MIKYKVNGEFLDQFDNAKDFAITKQISKIGEIDLRHGDYSTGFKVPLTANNARILRYASELNGNLGNTIDKFDRFNGQLIQDDAVISDGYYQVKGFNPTKKEVDLRFFGGNSDWFDLLKDRFINQRISIQDSEYPYDLDEANHKYTEDNIVSSWDQSNELKYYYFLNNNGKNDIKPITDVMVKDDFRFGVYEKFIFERIFESIGVTLKGNIFSDPLYHNTVISSYNNIEDVETLEYNKVWQLEDSSQTINTSYAPILFNTGNNDSRWTGSIFTSTQDNLNFAYDVKVSFAALSGDGFEDVNMRYRINNGSWIIVSMQVDYNEGGSHISYVTGNVTLNNNDVIEFQFEQGYSTNRNIRNTNNWIDKTFFKYEITTNETDQDLSVMNYLPSIKQTNFVKEVLFRLGAVSQYDKKTKTLTLNKFETIQNNIGKSLDWSNKIDLSKEISVDYNKIVSNYAKESTIDYKEDSNDNISTLLYKIYNQAFGSGTINIENDFLSDRKKIYESQYAPTVLYKSFRSTYGGYAEFFVPYIPTYKISGEDENGEATYENNDIEPRILIATGLVPVGYFASDYDEIQFNGTTYSNIGYAYFVKPYYSGGDRPQDYTDTNKLTETLAYDFQITNTDEVYTGDTLLSKNYNLYQKILNNPVYVPIYLHLDNYDMQTVDFLKPIYLSYKYDSGYYYIDSIEQYKGDGSTTKVNLVKI